MYEILDNRVELSQEQSNELMFTLRAICQQVSIDTIKNLNDSKLD